MSIVISLALVSLALPQDAPAKLRWRLVPPSSAADARLLPQPEVPHAAHAGGPIELRVPADALLAGGDETPWIGVGLMPEGQAGLEVIEVYDGSPAAAAGLRGGDTIVSVDGAPTPDFDTLRAELSRRAAGDVVQMDIRRPLAVVLDKRGYGQDGEPRLGVTLGGEAVGGWTISEVSEGWPAASAGLRAGDRILSVQGESLESFEQLMGLMAPVEPGGELRVVVLRGIELRLGKRAAAPNPGQLTVPARPRWELAEPGSDPRSTDPGDAPHSGGHHEADEGGEFTFEWHLEPEEHAEVHTQEHEHEHEHEHADEHVHEEVHEDLEPGIWVLRERDHEYADQLEDLHVERGGDVRFGEDDGDPMAELQRELRGLRSELRSLRRDIQRLSRDLGRLRGEGRGR